MHPFTGNVTVAPTQAVGGQRLASGLFSTNLPQTFTVQTASITHPTVITLSRIFSCVLYNGLLYTNVEHRQVTGDPDVIKNCGMSQFIVQI